MGAREDWWHDPGDDLELHPTRTARTRPARDPGSVDVVASVLLIGAAVLVSPAAWFAVVIGQFAFVACAQPATGCVDADVDAIAAAVRTWHLVLTLVVLVAGIAGSVARRSRRRTGWPVAMATLFGVLVVFAGAVTAIQIASGGNLF